MGVQRAPAPGKAYGETYAYQDGLPVKKLCPTGTDIHSHHARFARGDLTQELL